ncbi:cupredoxin domain-containing protein [Pararhodobacter aggregans]|uniref:Copper-binding protein n=1 Tax=Pararhodobacter aggregans TaxID=404875 RepID=A0A2T7UVQ2_9RHOB|nr:cupredoxin family copper-binding protein [Pararhodobacter aggregans]PTX03862.1 plastocyanin [Pararhodobacter aggregans]PVE48658.1 copper-binding protein [Pararhodobacter aggregans]
MTDISRRAFLITAAAVPASLAALPAAAATQDVTIQGMAFAPQTITIAAGDTVRWTNQDGAPHTATFQAAGMDTGRLSRGGTGELTFAQPGTYDYVCAIHPSMRGRVVVTG